MEPLALSIAVALFLVALFRMPGLTEPALAHAQPVTGTIPTDEDEELPQTDRAPSRHWLPWTVAAVGAIRLALLVTLHA
jgi:hypothetical protein